MVLAGRLYWSAFLAATIRGQSRYPFRSLAAIAADRDRAVQAMVAHAFHRVPYYRDALHRLGITPRHVRTFADLAKLPLVDAAALLESPGRFLASDARLHTCLSLKTSGSGGLHRTIHVDRAAIFRNAAQGERERCMLTAAIGRRHGYREAVIVLDPDRDESSTPRVQRFMRRHAFFPRGVEARRLYIDASDPPARFLPRLNDFEPDVIQGYGSSIDDLVRHVLATGDRLHRPRAVLFHSDSLATATRVVLADMDVPVFSTYEACEALKIGFECDAHEGYHVNIDTYPVRIVGDDGQDVPAGAIGRVVVSNLSNRATVLLNYDLGDQARWLPAPCRCGRTLPRLELVEGSAIPCITLPSGRIINPTEIYAVFLGESSLREHQVVHVSPDRFRLVLVIPDEACRAACGMRVAEAFRTLCGVEVAVEVVYADRISPTKAGKKRNFIPLEPP